MEMIMEQTDVAQMECRKIHYGDNPFFKYRGKKYELGDFDRETGLHQLSFTNCGNFAGFRIHHIEYGIDDYVVLEKI